MLIFPEGTCVNNTCTVMFQKGVFEAGVSVIPVSIKYGEGNFDPYWNRREKSFLEVIWDYLTTVSFDVNVVYHEPIRKKKTETSSDFAMRCKKIISDSAELKNMKWDGYLKNFSTFKADHMLQQSFLYLYCTHSDFNNSNYDELMENLSQNYLNILSKKVKVNQNRLKCSCE